MTWLLGIGFNCSSSFNIIGTTVSCVSFSTCYLHQYPDVVIRVSQWICARLNKKVYKGFLCLFVCLFTLCSQVECRPPMLSFNVHLMPKKAWEGYLVHNALSHCSIIMWKVAMVVPGNNIFVHKNLKYLYVFFTYPNVGLLQHFFNYHPRPDNKL